MPLTLPETGRWKSSSQWGRLEGAVADRDGRPTRATVTLVPKNGPATSIQSAYAGANGSFTLHGIRKGAYNLFARDV